MTDGKKVLTVDEAAKELGVSRNLIYRQVRAGTIPSVRLGDRWLISRISLDRFLEGAQGKSAKGSEHQ